MPTNNIVRQGFKAIDVTPSDSTDITGADANNPAALYVGNGGDVEVITLNGDTVVSTTYLLVHLCLFKSQE